MFGSLSLRYSVSPPFSCRAERRLGPEFGGRLSPPQEEEPYQMELNFAALVEQSRQLTAHFDPSREYYIQRNVEQIDETSRR